MRFVKAWILVLTLIGYSSLVCYADDDDCTQYQVDGGMSYGFTTCSLDPNADQDCADIGDGYEIVESICCCSR